jgi:hypothetical protein
MKSIILKAIICVLFVSNCLAQTEKTPSKKVISVCPFQIGERGKAANFRFGFSYFLEVGASGNVTKIEEFASTQRFKEYKFVRDELFIDCMKKWRLEPTGKYFVGFYVGTGSIKTAVDMPRNYMRIVDPAKQELIIELLLDERDVLQVDKTKQKK